MIDCNRYFFALKPEDETRDKIVLTRSQLSCSGRWVKTQNIHLTLLFLGNISQEQQYKVINEAKKIAFPEFELSLDKTGYFKKSQVAWLGFDRVHESLLILNQQILKAVKQSNISISQQTYKPHVTLARKSEKINKIVVDPVNWKIINFVLLKSIDTQYGVKYQLVETFKCRT
ncbi:MAG: RNA 2',3'-cyclic phosphodiesterase [gamma proteobacterium symbiont of Taylorina sp.]|nr:RNA 2',3'-cyclic phosphodiesterase [gamma proteobacterium symbiont of Taylorina sp.]